MERWSRTFVNKPFEGIEKGLKEEIISDAVSRLLDKLYQNSC